MEVFCIKFTEHDLVPDWVLSWFAYHKSFFGWLNTKKHFHPSVGGWDLKGRGGLENGEGGWGIGKRAGGLGMHTFGSTVHIRLQPLVIFISLFTVWVYCSSKRFSWEASIDAMLVEKSRSGISPTLTHILVCTSSGLYCKAWYVVVSMAKSWSL